MTALTDPDLFRQQALIDGNWIDAASGKTVDVVDPASGRTIGTIPDLGRDETRRAIEAAEKAFASFRRTSHAARAAMLEKWYGLILDHQEDLARIMTLEQGKPLAEARGEIVYTASFVKWYAEEARRIGGCRVAFKGEMTSSTKSMGVLCH